MNEVKLSSSVKKIGRQLGSREIGDLGLFFIYGGRRKAVNGEYTWRRMTGRHVALGGGGWMGVGMPRGEMEITRGFLLGVDAVLRIRDCTRVYKEIPVGKSQCKKGYIFVPFSFYRIKCGYI